MNKPPHPSLAIRISSAAAFAALVSMQIVACSDDENHPSSNPEAGAGGDEGTGGTSSGGRSSGGAGGGTGGSGAKAGAGGGSTGGSSSGGSAGDGGGVGGMMEAGTGTGGGVPEAGVPDASQPTEPDAAPDAPAGPPPCAPPTDPTKASLCLDFDPDVVKPIDSDPGLDGEGTLIISIWDHQPANPGEAPQMKLFYPPGMVDGGSGREETSVYSLPEIPIDDLPETVYVRTFFADNSAYIRFPVSDPVLPGVFVGGLDLTQGVVNLQTGDNLPLTVRTVTLKKGEGTRVKQHLTAMRKFSTKVSLDVTSYADDGQGPISVGVFDVAAPAGAPVLGGGRSLDFAHANCVKLSDPAVNPYSISGIFFGSNCTASSPCERWLGGQLDDFNRGGLSKPGSIVSLGAGATGQLIPDDQKFTFTDEYSVDIPKVSLNVVLPGSTGFTPYPCP